MGSAVCVGMKLSTTPLSSERDRLGHSVSCVRLLENQPAFVVCCSHSMHSAQPATDKRSVECHQHVTCHAQRRTAAALALTHQSREPPTTTTCTRKNTAAARARSLYAPTHLPLLAPSFYLSLCLCPSLSSLPCRYLFCTPSPAGGADVHFSTTNAVDVHRAGPIARPTSCLRRLP